MDTTEPQREDSENAPPSELESLRSTLKECEKERDELVDVSKRLKADFVNYKKDQEKVMGAFAKFAARDVIERLLPTLDSFELAMRHVPREFEDNNWTQGIKQIKQQIDAALKDVGVAEVRALREKFDPSMHEAVAEEAADGEEGKVMEVLQKGYTLHGEVLRAAKVKISKKKE